MTALPKVKSKTSLSTSQSAGVSKSIFHQTFLFLNVNVFDVTQIGVSFDQIISLSADSVKVFGVRERVFVLMDKITDRECCLARCTCTKDNQCFETSLTNSIVVGCPFAGFLAPGYSCNETIWKFKSSVFKNNVAHFVAGYRHCHILRLSIDRFQNLQPRKPSARQIKLTNGRWRFADYKLNSLFKYRVSWQHYGHLAQCGRWNWNRKNCYFQESFVYGETNNLKNNCPDKFFSITGVNCICKDKIRYMPV